MITLRPALAADALFLSRLEAEVIADHAQALWGRFVQPEISGFDLGNTRIVELDGAAIGYLTIEDAEDHLRLRKLYLSASHQGRGLGRRLLAQARAEAAARDLPLRLSVLRPNGRALAFYLREGMQVEQTTPERVFLFAAAPSRAAERA